MSADNEQTKSAAATTDLEDLSGRWIRDQLRDVGTEDETNAPQKVDDLQPEQDASTLTNLAETLTRAVMEPMTQLERRRDSENRRLQALIEEHAAQLERLTATVERLEGDVERRRKEAGERLEALQQTVDMAGAGLRRDAEELSASLVKMEGRLDTLTGRLDQLAEAHAAATAAGERRQRSDQELAQLCHRAAEALTSHESSSTSD